MAAFRRQHQLRDPRNPAGFRLFFCVDRWSITQTTRLQNLVLHLEKLNRLGLLPWKQTRKRQFYTLFKYLQDYPDISILYSTFAQLFIWHRSVRIWNFAQMLSVTQQTNYKLGQFIFFLLGPDIRGPKTAKSSRKWRRPWKTGENQWKSNWPNL